MTKELLENKTVKELRNIAKAYSIKGRWDMNKSQLIDSIVSVSEPKNNEVIDNKPKSCSDKIKYIEDVAIGTLVAFNCPDGKVRSAKVVKKSKARKMLKVVTEYKAEFIISYEDIIWVRTGKRWPKGVYNLLKGIKANG